MKSVVLITGGSGMLAKHLAKHLDSQYSIRFLTRKKTSSNDYLWDIKKKFIDPKALIGVDYIIHLAGSSIANKRWSKKRKEDILSSRVDSAHLILEKLKENKITIKIFISASAVGFYGTKTTEKIYTEESPKGNDFLSYVCGQWENTAFSFRSNNMADKVSIVRIGVILAKDEGAFKKIVQPIKYSLGSLIGKGTQYMPWIHISDLCGIIKFLLENKKANGIFNAVAPNHITNKDLTKEIAKQLHRKLILPNIPRFIIQGLFGEMAMILLEGSRVSSDKILKYGFKFEYNNLSKALNNLIKK